MSTAEAPSFSPRAVRVPARAEGPQRARVVQREQVALRGRPQGAGARLHRGHGLPAAAGGAAPDRGQALAVPDLPRHALRQGQDAVQDARRHLLPPRPLRRRRHRRDVPAPRAAARVHGRGHLASGLAGAQAHPRRAGRAARGLAGGGRGRRAGVAARRGRAAQAPAGGLRQGAPADRGHQAQEVRDHVAAHARARRPRAASSTSARRAPREARPFMAFLCSALGVEY